MAVTRHIRVKIIATQGTLRRWQGQECDAIYMEGQQPQINAEQLKPQGIGFVSVAATDLRMVREGWGKGV